MIVSSAISTARAFGHILVHSLHQVPRPGGSARGTAVNLTWHCADAGSSFVLMRNSLSGKSTRTPCRPGVTPQHAGQPLRALHQVRYMVTARRRRTSLRATHRLHPVPLTTGSSRSEERPVG